MVRLRWLIRICKKRHLLEFLVNVKEPLGNDILSLKNSGNHMINLDIYFSKKFGHTDVSRRRTQKHFNPKFKKTHLIRVFYNAYC